MEQEIREALERATPGPWFYSNEYDEIGPRNDSSGDFTICKKVQWGDNGALIANAPTYLEWCLSQITELRKENERLKTCPDCGGSGVVELCHDPLYTEPCICTMDFMGENRELADEVNRLRKQIESKQDQNQGGSSKWTNTTNTP